MKKRYEIHRGQISYYKIQYYIWDSKLKITVVNIYKGGIKTAHEIAKILNIS